MIESPTERPHLDEHSRPALIARLACAVWAGLPWGLALARLLYEIAPLRLAFLGGVWPSLALGMLGVAVWWGMMTRLPSGWEDATAACLPPALLWIHVLAPSLDVQPLRGAVLLAGTTMLSAVLIILRRGERSGSRHLPLPAGTLSVALIALAGYLLTLQRTIGRADTFEFQVTAPVLGVAHPTGYPLFILLGKAFSLLPLGMVATRVNLVSAVAAAVAVALVYETLRRALRVNGIIPVLAALAFAFSPTFWSQAVVAEVYALHNAFAAAILGGALWLAAQGGGDGQAEVVPRVMVALLALVGFSLANHLTTVLLLPALAAAILIARPRLTARQWALGAGLLGAGLLLYAYIPLRWPALHDGRLMSLDEFVGWVTGSRFSGALQLRAWLDDPERWRIVGRLLLEQYGWPGIALGIVGLGLMIRENWRAALITGLTFAAQGFYGLNYLVPDIAVFLIPMYLIMALWIGNGLGVVANWLAEQTPDRWRHAGLAALATAFSLLPMREAWTTGGSFDWESERALEAWGRAVLNLPLAEGSAVLVDSEKIAPLEYLHRIEGLRPDLSIVVLGTEEEYVANLYARIEAGQTVYLQRFLPGLEGVFHLRSLGPLIEVGTEPLNEPPPLEDERRGWENGIILLGHRSDSAHVPVGGQARITLYWQATEPPMNNYQVRLRLVNPSGEVVWTGAPAHPVSNRYPTVAWKGDEIVPDYHAVPVPYTLLPGTYALQVALAPPFSDDLVPLSDGEKWATVTALTVEAPRGRPPLAGRRAAITFPGGALNSVDAPEQAPDGGTATLTAGWLVGEGGFWTESTLPAEGGAETIRLPGRTGEMRLEARRISTGEGEALRWQIAAGGLRCGWLRPLRDSCPLATTRIEGETVAQAIANFDNRLLLTGVEFEAGQLRPGEPLAITLEWQSLRTMEEDYTVFVHLVGPDGRLHGQVDQWPVQGTYPTSTWPPGERVIDRYTVFLDPDAPPGSYEVWVGLYLLSTNTRLPVIGPEGNPIDDKVAFGGLLVPER